MNPIRIGIIGSSGLYKMDGLTDTRERTMETPFGAPSAALLLGKLDGVDVAFLARHGRGHALIPSEIPFRADIYPKARRQLLRRWGGRARVVGRPGLRCASRRHGAGARGRRRP